MKNTLFLFVLLLLVQSCRPQNDTQEDKRLQEIATQGIKDFNRPVIEGSGTYDSIALYDAYRKIQESRLIGKIQLSEQTAHSIFQVYALLHKWENAVELYDNEKIQFDGKEKYVYLTKVFFYKRSNPAESQKYARKGALRQKEIIAKKPDDFIETAGYFVFKSFWQGKERTFYSIDSMKQVNHIFSEIEYERGFKHTVEIYDNYVK